MQTKDNCLRSSYLSTSTYPYTDPETLAVNNSLTDESSPAATLFTAAADGRKFMGKSITNIQLAPDGTISFDFKNGEETGIETMADVKSKKSDVWYTIDGRCLHHKPTAKGLYIYNSKMVKVGF